MFGKRYVIIALLFLLSPLGVNANSSGYAWSESVGYFDFNNVVVSDSALSGNAYNDNTGYLVMDGVTQNGSGVLSGYAWSESVGYFDFNDVTISSGSFSGNSYNDNTGYLIMDGVSTTWAPASDDEDYFIPSGRRRSVSRTTDTNVTTPTQIVTPSTNVSPVSSQDSVEIIRVLIDLNIITEEDAVTILTILNNDSSNSSNSNRIFTKNLFLDIIDEEVRDLQRFLNDNGFTIAQSGPGSPGNETNIYGPLTQQAVIKFQSQNNISPAVGYFGPLTRGFIRNNY
jgi:hypothetical protein